MSDHMDAVRAAEEFAAATARIPLRIPAGVELGEN